MIVCWKVHLLYSETELNKVMDKCTFSLSDKKKLFVFLFCIVDISNCKILS